MRVMILFSILGFLLMIIFFAHHYCTQSFNYFAEGNKKAGLCEIGTSPNGLLLWFCYS